MSSSALSSAREQKRLELENRISEYSQKIIETKRDINRLLLPVVLPPELLIKVFRYVAHNSIIGLTSSWLESCTHVCHRWREAALDAPELWCTIVLGNTSTLDGTREMLARSQQMPLVVRSHPRYTPLEENPILHNEALDYVLRELPRIVVLDVSVSAYSMPSQGYPEDALLMKELMFYSPNGIMQPTASGNQQLLSHLLEANMPGLTSLEFHLPCMEWKHGVLRPALTHLTLSGTEKNPYFMIDDVLAILDSLPLLETLELRWALPISASPDPDTPFISLPNLRELTICDTAESCAELLRQISLSPAIKIKLDCTYRTLQSVNDVLRIIRLTGANLRRRNGVGENFASAILPTIRTFTLCGIVTLDATQLRAWTTYHTIDELYNRIRQHSETQFPDPLIDIILRHGGRRHFPALHLVHAIPVEDIKSAVLHPSHEKTYQEHEALIHLLSNMPSLRELGIGSFAHYCIHDVLIHSDRELQRDQIHEGFILPNLSVLALSMVGIPPVYDGVDFLEDLENMFGIRNDIGGARKLEKLILRACQQVADSDLKVFRPFANTVIREQASEDTDSM
ncbi:hypothetical protein BDY19DRAFT_930331 [Irpex rosettiformis]|uniref:Uncharacterized protein n=1 Tax=Irpex rosettiformis TaxID=378272 RepID=A0ACB8UAZ9_9APHY|nr:hypothetical protein BDY19DRAFT_930331 [Irpex rosettiformis]